MKFITGISHVLAGTTAVMAIPTSLTGAKVAMTSSGSPWLMICPNHPSFCVEVGAYCEEYKLYSNNVPDCEKDCHCTCRGRICSLRAEGPAHGDHGPSSLVKARDENHIEVEGSDAVGPEEDKGDDK